MPDTTTKKTEKKGLSPSPQMMKALEETPYAPAYAQNIKKKMEPDSSMFDMDMPTVGDPWLFQKDPPVRGMGLSQAYQNVIRQAPGLGLGKVSEIDRGPNTGSMALMRASGFPPDKYAGTSLWGTYEDDTNKISINPSLHTDEEMYGTLPHELMHSRGASNEYMTTPFSDLVAKLYRSSYGQDINLPASTSTKGLGYSKVKK